MTTKTEAKTEIAQQYDAMTLRKMLQEEQNRKLQQCMAEIEAVTKKHGAVLMAVPLITDDGRLSARVVVRLAPEATG